MIKRTAAAAALFGSVMVAPAHAVVDSLPTVNLLNLTFPQAASLYSAWLSAWDVHFGPAPTFLGSPMFSVVTYAEGPHFQSFISMTTNTGISVQFGMPVPGPIAGAGLPLIAAGIAFAAWRRRRSATAA